MASMEIEHDMRSFVFDDNLPKELSKLGAEGWQTIPGVRPIIVYHLMRPKQARAGADEGQHFATGAVHLDESKIGLMRDGKMVDDDIKPPIGKPN
jgi:hypothetical protein